MTTSPYRRGDPTLLFFSPRQPDGTIPDLTGMSVQLRISAGGQCIPLDGVPRDDGFDFDLSGLTLPPRLYVVSVYRNSGDGWRHSGDMFINITGAADMDQIIFQVGFRGDPGADMSEAERAELVALREGQAVLRSGQAAQGTQVAAVMARLAAASEAVDAESFTVASINALKASEFAFPVGATILTLAESVAYEVVPDGTAGYTITTAGGALLKAVWRGQQSDLVASGIDLTGGADATPLLNAYLAAFPGLVVSLPPGTYRLNNTVNVPSDTNLDLRNCVFDLTGLATGQPAFKAAGTQNAAITMTSRPIKGASEIFLDSTAGLVSGDMLRVTSDLAFDPSRTNSKIGELARIKSVRSDRVVLHAPLLDDYTEGANGRVHKINAVRRVNIFGPAKLLGGNSGNRKGIWIEKAVDCRISGMDFFEFDDRALWVQDCDNVNGNALTFQDFDSAGTGYGISCLDATQNCRFSDIHGRRVRHLFATNNTRASNGIPRLITVDGFSVDASAIATGGTGGDAMDTHAASEHITFMNGFIRGATGCGINSEGASTIVHNVWVMDCLLHGIYAANFSTRPGVCRITDCVVEGAGGSGIRVRGNGKQRWLTAMVHARVSRCAAGALDMSGSEAKLTTDVRIAGDAVGGTFPFYFNNCRNGMIDVMADGQTETSKAVYLVRLRDCISISARVTGRMNSSIAGSRAVDIDGPETTRNVDVTVNIRNDTLAGTGVSIRGGTNMTVAASPRIIDNFTTAITGAT